METLYKTALETMLEYSERSLNVPESDRERIRSALQGDEDPRNLFRDFVRDAGMHQHTLSHYAEAAMEGRHPTEGCVWPECPAKQFPYGAPVPGAVAVTPTALRTADDRAQGTPPPRPAQRTQPGSTRAGRGGSPAE